MAIIAKGQLLIHASPEVLLQTVVGRVWDLVVNSTDLAAAQSNRLVSACIRRSDGVHLRIVSDTSPGPGAQSMLPTLEDAYLYHLAAHRDPTVEGSFPSTRPAQSRAREKLAPDAPLAACGIR
jgi:ABC-2 type transport system ATP-binding protein